MSPHAVTTHLPLYRDSCPLGEHSKILPFSTSRQEQLLLVKGFWVTWFYPGRVIVEWFGYSGECFCTFTVYNLVNLVETSTELVVTVE